jgi:hypothetical protein
VLVDTEPKVRCQSTSRGECSRTLCRSACLRLQAVAESAGHSRAGAFGLPRQNMRGRTPFRSLRPSCLASASTHGCTNARSDSYEPLCAQVVHGAVRAVGPARFHPQCVLAEQSGRGNNWAAGFHGPTVAEAGPGHSGLRARGSSAAGGGGGAICEAALEALRWQWERSDACAGVLLAHSLGGGTGSGLGSRLLVELRDRHPKHHLLSACAAPFGPGELPLAAYNATLALASMHGAADGIFYFDNAGLMRSLAGGRGGAAGANGGEGKGGVRGGGGAGDVGVNGLGSAGTGRLCMRHLDAHIAACLAGLTFPIDTAGGLAFSIDTAGGPAAVDGGGASAGFGFGGFACDATPPGRPDMGLLRTRPFHPGIVSTDLAPMPRLKLLSLYTARGPQATPPPGVGPPVRQAAERAAGGARRPAAWGGLVEQLLDEVSRVLL